MTDSKAEPRTELFGPLIEALELEIKAIKQKGGGRKIKLNQGVRSRLNEGKALYDFKVEDPAGLRDDLPIILVDPIDDSRTSGTLLSLSETTLTIELEKDCGEVLDEAILTLNNSLLMVRLKNLLEQANQGGSEKLNPRLIAKVFGLEEDGKLEALDQPNRPPGLNDRQWQAVESAHSREVLFLWGPPGTGKTSVMSKVLESYYRMGRRVLVVSNTNMAVDTLLEKLCRTLHQNGDRGFRDGALLRYGTIAKPELEQHFAEQIVPEEVAERKAAQWHQQIEQLRPEQTKVKQELDQVNQILEQLEALRSAQEALRKAVVEHGTLTKRQDHLSAQCGQAERKLKVLEDQRTAAETAGMLGKLFGPSAESIQNQMEDVQERLGPLSQSLKHCQEQLQQKSEEIKGREAEVKTLEGPLDGLTLESQQSKKAKLSKQLGKLNGEISELQARIESIQEQVIKEAQIIGTSASKSFLQPGPISGFDAVVIDEASMLPLPVVAYVAGLAKENVVLAGDFRQLPPIAMSMDDRVREWFGQDIFSKAGIDQLAANGGSEPRMVQLNYQYRMQEKICGLINQAHYNGNLNTGIGAGKSPFDPKSSPLVSSPLVLVDTSKLGPICSKGPEGRSRINLLNALSVRAIARQLQRCGVIEDSGSVAAIAPYSAQAKLTAQLLEEDGLELVSTGTVHRYQGNEKRIIIYDVTEGIGMRPWDFTTASKLSEDGAKLLNVAVSRAQSHFILLADVQEMERTLPQESFHARLIRQMREQAICIDLEDLLNLRDLREFEVRKEQGALPAGDLAFFDEQGFEEAFLRDVESAREFVVVYSAFMTANRVRKWIDSFQDKTRQGVKFRVATKPPNEEGIADDHVRRAAGLLLQAQVGVDFRWKMHEKICIIDGRVMWHGSLNPLSYTGKTSESMLRITSRTAIENMAESLKFARKPQVDREADAMTLLPELEHPYCPCCKVPTNYIAPKEKTPFYACDNRCGWTQSASAINTKPSSASKSKKNRAGTPGGDQRKKQSVGRKSDNRLYVDVPFAEKDEAKGLGARWDPSLKCWYFHLDREDYTHRWSIKEL